MLFKAMVKDKGEGGESKSANKGEDKPTKGARDEFEAIVLVVRDDKILLQKVLDKIRKHRELSSKSILDLGKAQAEAKETARKNRSR
jgi:hypothetical protein